MSGFGDKQARLIAVAEAIRDEEERIDNDGFVAPSFALARKMIVGQDALAKFDREQADGPTPGERRSATLALWTLAPHMRTAALKSESEGRKGWAAMFGRFADVVEAAASFLSGRERPAGDASGNPVLILGQVLTREAGDGAPAPSAREHINACALPADHDGRCERRGYGFGSTGQSRVVHKDEHVVVSWNTRTLCVSIELLDGETLEMGGGAPRDLADALLMACSAVEQARRLPEAQR